MDNSQNSTRNRVVQKQLVRYAIVGVASNTAGYLVYLLITYLGVPPKTAMSVLYVVGATFGFVGNSRLTFSYKGGVMGAGMRYLLCHTLGYLMNLTALILFVDIFGYPHHLVQGVAVFAVAAFLFVTFKFFVFCDTKSGSIGEKV